MMLNWIFAQLKYFFQEEVENPEGDIRTVNICLVKSH